MDCPKIGEYQGYPAIVWLAIFHAHVNPLQSEHYVKDQAERYLAAQEICVGAMLDSRNCGNERSRPAGIRPQTETCRLGFFRVVVKIIIGCLGRVYDPA